MKDFTEIITKFKKKHGHKEFVPKAVLFDMDGVLYNSMPRHAIAWHYAMTKEGINMPEMDAYKYEGMRGVETIILLFQKEKNILLTEEEAAKIYMVKSAAYAAQGKAPIMPGVHELMEDMQAKGLTIGVVTGSGQETLLRSLETDFAGIVSRERMVTSFDVTRGKPDPMPYLQGLKKVGVAANEAIVVENAPLGVRAAVRAGIFTIAVNTGPLPDSILADEGADLIFHDMFELHAALPFILNNVR